MNPKKIRHIYNGVSSPVNYTAENRRLYFQKIDLNPSLFTIGILGRIVTGKGQRYCIEAVNILHQQQYTVQLIIAGYVMDSAYLEECKRFVQSVNLEKYVRFIDFIEQPMTMLPTLDVVVLASKCEGFGNILIEAMRCEIPVIGSNAGGVPEIITHEKSGLLFEPENSADLAEKIKFLIDYPDERKKMATYGKTMADEFFDEDKNYAMLIKLYKEIQGSGKTYSFIAVFVFTGLIVSQILIHFSYARQ
jgi:glycosyltransferase involved in cell wall biosynthesis